MSKPSYSPTASVPTLAAVQADPTILDSLSLDLLLEFRRQIGYLGVNLDAAIIRRTVAATRPQQPPGEEGDKLLTADEAGKIAGVTPSWLVRNSRRLPFARKLSQVTLPQR